MIIVLLVLILLTLIFSSSSEMFLFAIFGKRWLNWSGKKGLKAAIFAKQNEIDMVQEMIYQQEHKVEEINEALTDGSWSKKLNTIKIGEAIKIRDGENMQIEMLRADIERKNAELSNAQKKLEFLRSR